MRFKNKSRKWQVLFISLFVSFSFLFSLQSYPPVLPEVMAEFGLSNTQASLPMSLAGVPMILLAIPAWIYVSRLGFKKAGLSGISLCVLGGAVSSLSNNFGLFLTGRIILGVGGIVTLIVSFSVISVWFSEKERGRAMGIRALDMPLATSLAFNLIPHIHHTWRVAFITYTVLLVISGVTFVFLFPGSKSFKSQSMDFRHILNREMWILGVIWAFFTMTTSSYMSWGGVFFMEYKGLSPPKAFLFASIIMISLIVVAPIVGELSDRTGKRKIYITISGVVMSTSLLIIPHLSLPALYIAVVVFGIFALSPPVVFALISEVLPGESSALGFGVLFTFLGVGNLLGPFIIGMVRDTSTGMVPSFLIMASFSFITSILSLFLKTR